jgi:site-specific recombinase XerD
MKGEPSRKRMRRHTSTWIVNEGKCLSINEIQKLRKYCQMEKAKGIKNRQFTRIRNWFMIELGLNTGLRVNEIATLKHVNLFTDNDRSSILVNGKGNKIRPVWISSEFKRACKSYIYLKSKFGYNISPNMPLLNNLKGGFISKRALQKFFKAIIVKAGLPDHYYFHCLRHTYTTFLLKASNHNYRFAQQQLGHASIQTTQIYAGVLESEGRKAIENLYG